MRKFIPLIFSFFSAIGLMAQANGGWGNCEFTTAAAMNAFDPSTSNFACKKAYVQATDDHYYWDGSAWIQITDDQNASEVPFTPTGTIAATNVQTAIAEIEPDIYGSVGVHDDVDITTTAPSSGDVLAWDGSNFVPQQTDNGYTIFNVFAEESVGLGNNAYEWSFGNGDQTPNGHGIVIPVDCELFAMSLDHESNIVSNTTVRIIKNTDATLTSYQVTNTGTEQGYVTFGTPLSFAAGDVANFRTISRTQNGNSGRVSAWFRIRATPASTSLVNDMLDVSAGSIASGDILYFDGSSYVPLTLNAANLPYDNATSGLTATDVKAAIDELASGSSSENIYNTSDALTADRVVGLNNNDLTFDGTGTGDVIIEADGDVGIGTTTPDAKLDVEGGNVRFSDYGEGTYLDAATETVPADATYNLAVDTNGDVVEVNTAKSSKIFYPPALVIDVSTTGDNRTLDLHQQYVTLYGTPAVVSSGAPTAIPTYGETELFYYVTDYDTGVFSDLEISADGILTYDVDVVPANNCAAFNVVFVVK